MGKPTGFLEFPRRSPEHAEVRDRVNNFDEFKRELDDEARKTQGARCMDCGVPFCQSDFGCPVDNLIPEWNDLVYRGRWEDAFYRLMRTNNFPEFTGRVCPAPCEHACVLGINESPVTIKENEAAIIDRAYERGFMHPRLPEARTGHRVAVVGSGPAGLAAADQLNHAGHSVTVFERSDKPGGLLMYGIPNMKLDKNLVMKRIDLMKAEGIEFSTGVNVGVDLPLDALHEYYDVILLAIGATRPRDLMVPGRNLPGVHFAMDFLAANTKHLLDADRPFIDAQGKHVIVIGGGDTGNDCLGTSIRHGCAGIVNFELMPKPPSKRTDDMPWPHYARTLKTDYGHEESAALFGRDPREYAILTKEFVGDDRLRSVKTVRVNWTKEPGARPRMEEIPGSEEEWPADLAFLSMGFLGPEDYLIDQMHVERDERSAVGAQYGTFTTSVPRVFAAGDARRGQSLVVWAINEGRGAAREIDRFLMGYTNLP